MKHLFCFFLAGVLFLATGCDSKKPLSVEVRKAIPVAPNSTPAPIRQKSEPILALPKEVKLSPAAYRLILEHEVGGGSPYYNKKLRFVNWPGYMSGLTGGVGYDFGMTAKPLILKDWAKLEARERLARTSGITGQKAKAIAPQYRDIEIVWPMAEEVYNRVTISRFWELTKKAFPGVEDLHPDAQGVLLSLVFNRGSAMGGERRTEMRAIRSLVPKHDYLGMAAQIRKMKRLWVGQGVDGLLRRREDEARLMEKCHANPVPSYSYESPDVIRYDDMHEEVPVWQQAILNVRPKLVRAGEEMEAYLTTSFEF